MHWIQEISLGAWLLIGLLLFILFLLLSIRPYTPREIERKAIRMVDKELSRFSGYAAHLYTNRIGNVDAWLGSLGFKPKLDYSGEFVQVNIPFEYGPACAAYWLKHKHHQWFMVLFARNKAEFNLIYGNKGKNRFDVENLLGDDRLFSYASQRGYETVLVFHNHPMSVDPAISLDDKQRAEKRRELAVQHDLNYQEFLCVTGGFGRPFNEHFRRSHYEKLALHQCNEKYTAINKEGAVSILKSRWQRSWGLFRRA